VIRLAGQLTAGLHTVAAVAEREFLAGRDGQGRVGVEDRRDLGPPDGVFGLEQGVAADEVVAEGDRPPVAQLVRRADVHQAQGLPGRQLIDTVLQARCRHHASSRHIEWDGTCPGRSTRPI